MSKNAGKRKGGILKLSSLQDMPSPKTLKKLPSAFDSDDIVFDNPAEPDEWEKLYAGQPSSLDDTYLDEEYRKSCKRQEKSNKESSSKNIFDDDDDNVTIHDLPLTAESESRPLTVQGIAQMVPEQEDTKAEDEAEKVDRALAVAEDFAKREKLVIIGGAIYRFNGKFCALLSEDEVQQLLFQNYREEISRASPLSMLRNAASLIKYVIHKRYSEFPVNDHLIFFENGTLEVPTGHFRKNSAKDLASSALGINYDPDRWGMPYTQHFLETIADGDDDLYELMLQVMGYIFSNDVKAKSFFYLEGVGDAGKSRFCDLIASFFPVDGANKVARIALQDLGGKFALGNLVNAKLNISEDLPDSPLSPTTVSRIKMISDSNRLEAEAKYVQPFSFRPTCKLLFASNHPLRLKEYDAAFMNRVVYIPFLHAIPKHKQDKNILEKMRKELPAVFNHAFEAYKRLVANGYVWAGADRFNPEIAVVGSGISMSKEQTLKQFVDECCAYDDNAITSTAELQEAYNLFCRENKYVPVMGDRFSRELAFVLPYEVTRVKIGNQRRGFKGLGLKPEYKRDIF